MVARDKRYQFVPLFTADMQQQIDATILNVGNNIVSNMEDYQKQYLSIHLKNLVETCLWLATQEKNDVSN